MKLEDVFARVLRVSPDAIVDTTEQGSVETWDSFQHIMLFVALEQAFGVKFTTGEIERLKSVRGIRAALTEKGARLR